MLHDESPKNSRATVLKLSTLGMSFMALGFILTLFNISIYGVKAYVWGIFCAALLMLGMMGYGAWKNDKEYAFMRGR
jgi:hypothetical protein